MTDPMTPAPADPQELRRRAEELAAARARDVELPPPERLEELVHELRVHQIELEMQNESLRRAQDELEASRDRYVDLYDFAPVGYVTLDERGIIREVNLTACEMLGCHRNMLPGRQMVSYIVGTGQNRFLGYLRQCQEQAPGEEASIEVALRTNHRGELPVLLQTGSFADPQTGARQYRMAMTGISELRQAERALRVSEARYRTLFESIDEGFCIIEVLRGDSAAPIDYRFLEVNPAFERQTGIENAVGCRMREIAPDHEEHWFEVYERVARTGEPIRFENVAEALGRVYDVYAFRVGEPDQRRVAVLFKDITPRKQAEEALRQLNESLEAQVAERSAVAERRAWSLRRLAIELSETEHRERSRLAKLLHDELQQLLLSAKLRLPVLVEGPSDQIPQHVSRLEELLSECLGTARNLSHELSPPILKVGTLAEALQWLGEWFGEKYDLSVAVDAADELPPVQEPLRVFLYQAVRELLFNVVKHSGQAQAWVAAEADDGQLTIAVEDRGGGFDAEAVESKLRDPKSFGLFNIRERLVALSGCLEITNAMQGGARFRLIVPLHADGDAPGEEVKPGKTAETTPSAGMPKPEDKVLRLLVVDDHAVVREGLVTLLDYQPGIEVVGEAHDGEEAISQAEKLRPDVVVMDVDMPHVDGIEATRRITADHPGIAVVGLSLHEEDRIARQMRAAGAKTFVNKHAPAKEVIETIRRAGD